MAEKNKAVKPLKDKDYEKLGRIIESVFENQYASRRRLYKINFMRGLFFGFGSLLGGTFLVALVLWILSFFSQIPFVGDFSDKLEESVNAPQSVIE